MISGAQSVPEYPVAPPQASAPNAAPRGGFPPLVWIIVGVVLAKTFDLVRMLGFNVPHPAHSMLVRDDLACPQQRAHCVRPGCECTAMMLVQASKLFTGGPGSVKENAQAMMMQKMMEQMMSGKGGPMGGMGGMPGMGGMDPSSHPFAAMANAGGGGPGGNPFGNMPPFPQQPAQSSPSASRWAVAASNMVSCG